MAKVLQHRRDTTTNLSSVSGAIGEFFMDTTKNTLVVMDGSTNGGHPLALESSLSGKQDTLVSGTSIKTVNGTSLLGSGNVTISGYTDSDVDAHLNQSNPTNGYVLSWDATVGDYAWVSNAGYTNSDVDTHLNTSSATSNYVLSWNGSDYAWVAQASGADGNTQYTMQADTATGGANLALVGNDASIDSVKFAAGSNITITRDDANTITIASTASGGSADFSSVSEDVLPAFDGVYDLGSPSYQWYDVFVSNTVTIGGASLTGNTTGLVTDTVLIGDILHTSNTLTPDASTAIQYGGDQGVVDINGNLDASAGDWMFPAIVETAPVTVASYTTEEKTTGTVIINRFGRISVNVPSAYGSYVGTTDGTENNPLAIVFTNNSTYSQADRDAWIEAWNKLPIDTEFEIWVYSYNAFKLKIIKKRHLNPSGFDAGVWKIDDWKNSPYSSGTSPTFSNDNVGAVLLFKGREFEIASGSYTGSFSGTKTYQDTWDDIGGAYIGTLFQYVRQSETINSVEYTWEETVVTTTSELVAPSSVGLEGMVRYNKDETALELYTTAWNKVPLVSDIPVDAPEKVLFTEDERDTNGNLYALPGKTYVANGQINFYWPEAWTANPTGTKGEYYKVLNLSIDNSTVYGTVWKPSNVGNHTIVASDKVLYVVNDGVYGNVIVA